MKNVFGKVIMLSGLLSLVSCGLIKPPDPPFSIRSFAISPDAEHLVIELKSRLFFNTRKKRSSGLLLYDVKKREFVAEYRSHVKYGGGVSSIGQVFTNDGENIILSLVTNQEKRADGSLYSVWRLAMMNKYGGKLHYLTEPEEDTTVYFPALSHSGKKVAYIKVKKEDLHYKKGQSQAVIRYAQILETDLDGTYHKPLIPYKINYPPPPAYMPNDQDVAFIAASGFTSGADRGEYVKQHGENFLFVMGDKAGFDVKPFAPFSKEYQDQDHVVVLDDRRMIISLTGARINSKLLLYDFEKDTRQLLRDPDDEYRDFDGTALNMHPPSARNNRRRWRFSLLSHARDAGKVAVLLKNATTHETHIRIMDLADYSLEDAGVYDAWMKVVSGEVTLKNLHLIR